MVNEKLTVSAERMSGRVLFSTRVKMLKVPRSGELWRIYGGENAAKAYREAAMRLHGESLAEGCTESWGGLFRFARSRSSGGSTLGWSEASGTVEDENRTLLEAERLKTQLISERRAVLLARQQNAELAARNESPIEALCDLAKANKDLQAALIAQNEDRVCLREVHRGTVTEILGEQVEVFYETAEGRLKQVYSRDQFAHGRVPDEGDNVQALVIMAVTKRLEAQTEPEETSDLPDFRDKGVSGTIRI